MPELLDVVLVVAKRDDVQIAFRRFGAREFVEATCGEHLIDRAQPVRAFRMSGGRRMVEASRVSKKKRGHAVSWRVGRACREGANLGARRPVGKGGAAKWPGFNSLAQCD